MKRTNKGTAFERELVLVFGAYEKEGRAMIRKVDPPTRVLGRRIVQLPSDYLDFVGSWSENDGRMIMIEAKHTEKPRLNIRAPKGSPGVTAKQYEDAVAWDAAGAVCLFLWRYQDQVRVTTPSLALVACQDRGEKSLRWCDAYKMPTGRGFLLYDPLTWARALF